MFEVPAHLIIPVTVRGDGPVSEDDAEFDHYACWCGDPECVEGP
jgi:hypothetical protein